MKKITLVTFSSIVSLWTLLVYNIPFFLYVAQNSESSFGGKLFLITSLVIVMLVLNFKTNQPEILDVQDVLSGNYPPLYLLAQKSDGEFFYSMQRGEDTDNYYVNCEDLIRKTNFTRLMRDILHQLDGIAEGVGIDFLHQAGTL